MYHRKGARMNEIGRKIVDKLIELHGSKDFKIAFLPYKRSMWNSMSSVYDECIRSGIDAHVYPIPYLRMDTKEVVSDYEYFENAEDIETLSDPDYIAIHYYYDDLNAVTNMLPEYYTNAIKERYKCKIIFLPYGIKYTNTPEGFFLYTGFRDMDYIFTTEINEEFINAWKEQGVDFTGRIFDYGSAKLDAARNITNEKTDTTLILNSLVPYLNNPYRSILNYLMYALREISKWRKVIFRPHPLLRISIKTSAPESEPYYDFLIKELHALGVTIDESEYLERALCAADYLISDPSSVLIMWKETGKPYTEIGGNNGQDI